MIKKIEELIVKWEGYRDQYIEGCTYYNCFDEMVADLEELLKNVFPEATPEKEELWA